MADGNDVVAIVNGPGAIVRLSCCVCEQVPSFAPEASVTLTVNELAPTVVGVPEIDPPLLRDRPAGSAEPLARLQVSAPAPPLAWRLAL